MTPAKDFARNAIAVVRSEELDPVAMLMAVERIICEVQADAMTAALGMIDAHAQNWEAARDEIQACASMFEKP